MAHLEVMGEFQGPGEERTATRCYPMYGWGPDVDARAIVERERVALQRLDDLDRGWRVQASFVHEARQWTVVPLVPPRPSNSLVASVIHGEPPRVDGHLPREVGLNVVRDAFTGLQEVHEEGLLHRGLHPRRIYLGRGDLPAAGRGRRRRSGPPRALDGRVTWVVRLPAAR
ncbi:hypothetical protein [Dactylosporangium sp. CA-092794]|uniref:hypothetical protein n=1 Tax=Dactylosporangium sp. CA-092794 TaxID=3239929 RepID=UPI003D912C47